MKAIYCVINIKNCISCNPILKEKIFDSSFLPNLILMLSAFIVLGAIVAVLSFLSTRRYRISRAAYTTMNFLTLFLFQ
ncbi:MAG: hypothetical protein HC905_14505, partial [Bacteroidales bacterium]|nr:hypothetical protein [Bacteroidales bacterium]